MKCTGVAARAVIGILFMLSVIKNTHGAQPFHLPMAVKNATATNVGCGALVCKYPTSVKFDATGSVGYKSPTITSYVWDFGDGHTATGVIATNIYTAVGAYLAKLTVTDSAGGTRQEFNQVYILTNAPAVMFTITASAGAGGAISPSGSVSAAQGDSPTFVIAANNGYNIADVKVDGVSQGAVSSYPFTNVQTNHTIAATFAVAAVAPTITGQPTNRTVTVGQTATFSVTAGGTAPLVYQWRKNAVNISGATAASYTTPVTVIGDNGALYSVVVSNAAGSVTSSNATLTVNTAAIAPTITGQPTNRTVTVGQTATFSVTAGGTAPLAYQWRKNAVNISGATAASYTTPVTVIGDNGALYSVVVSNAAGSVTSSNATLTVNAATVAPVVTITSPVSGTTMVANASITIQATATDSDGTVTNVEFYSGGLKLGEDKTSPYSLTWGGVGAGTYTLTVKATDNSGLSTVSAPVTVTVLPVVTLSVSDGWASEPGTDTGRFTVLRNSGTGSVLTVHYVMSGTAGNGVDYQTLSGSVVLPAGVTSSNILVVPVEDALVEGKETAVITLLTDTDYRLSGATTGAVWILDNEQPVVTLSVADSMAVEGSSDSGRFTINRSGLTNAALTVPYLIGGTASNGVDYVSLPGSVVVPAGSISATVTVTALNDALVENKETVTLTLKDGTGYQTGSSTNGTVTIFDDEMAIVGVVVSDGDAAEPANNGEFNVTRYGATNMPVTVFYTTGGSTVKGTDYATPAGSVSMAAGVTSAVVSIVVTDDTLVEGREYVTLSISASNNLYQTGPQGSATINIYDDEKPEVRIQARQTTGAETMSTQIIFFVSCVPAAKTGLTVNCVVGGTATNGVDYQPLAGTVVIAAGTTNALVMVVPLDDMVAESVETVMITLAADPAYQIGYPAAATGNIYDNEPTVSVSAVDNSAKENPLNTGVFRILRSGGTVVPALAVNYTMGGTAVNGVDYTAFTGVAAMSAGASYVDIQLVPVADGVAEGSESAVMTLTASPGYRLGTSVATVTIGD